MEEKENSNFRRKLNLFLKNKKAFYDLLSLNELLTSNMEIESIIGTNLVEKVIRDLEDRDIIIKYKEDKFNTLFIKIENQYQELLDKFGNCEEYKNEIIKTKEEYKFKIAYNDFWRTKDNKFNIVLYLLKKSPLLTQDFLTSNIKVKERYSMLKDIIYKEIVHDPTVVAFILSNNNDNRLDKEKSNKISDLIELFNNNTKDKKELLEIILNNDKENYLKMFINNGINFNNLYGIAMPCKKKVSTVFKVFLKTGNVDKNLYDHDSYLEIDRSIRKNNDILILKLIDVDKISEFIRYKNFKLSDSKIRIITKRFIEEKVIDNNLKEDVFKAIIYKSKNRKELKHNLELANNFIKETEETIYARNRLYEVLNMVNDKAFENAINKMKVKKILKGK